MNYLINMHWDYIYFLFHITSLSWCKELNVNSQISTSRKKITDYLYILGLERIID